MITSHNFSDGACNKHVEFPGAVCSPFYGKFFVHRPSKIEDGKQNFNKQSLTNKQTNKKEEKKGRKKRRKNKTKDIHTLSSRSGPSVLPP